MEDNQNYARSKFQVSFETKELAKITITAEKSGILRMCDNKLLISDTRVEEGESFIQIFNNSQKPFVIQENEPLVKITEIKTMQIMVNNQQEIIEGVKINLKNKDSIQKILKEYYIIMSNSKFNNCKIKHSIELQENKQNPIFTRNFPTNPIKMEIIQKEVDNLLKEDVIQKSKSPLNSPLVLVKKPNGKYRLCIAFNRINEVTIKEVTPPPRIEETLDYLNGSTIFSSIDLKAGFHQIALDKESQKYTAFTTKNARYEYKKMPFGLCNAPSTFQNMMNFLCASEIGNFVSVYMDDIIIYSKNEEIHIEHLKRVFEILGKNGLEINPEKTTLGSKSISYLGFFIKDGIITPDPDRLLKIENYKLVKNAKGVQRFLGFINYYRKFIKNISEKTKTLYLMATEKISFNQNEANSNINMLIEELYKSEALTLPNFKLQFIVECDASDMGIGCVLLQNVNGNELTIKYGSRMLTEAERKYSTTEKEFLSIVYATKYFKEYLYNNFIIRTDHKPLLCLKSLKDSHNRIARWLIHLDGLDFNIQYKKGTLNSAADFLSRIELNILKIDNNELDIIEKAHVLLGHSGIEAITIYLAKTNSIDHLNDKVRKYILKCPECIKNSKSKKN